MNSVSIVGRLSKDPELRYTPAGQAVCSFTVAVRNPFVDNGVDFISCVAWQKTAETVANYSRKGEFIGVDGRINTRNYENAEGKRVYVTEINANQITLIGSVSANHEPEPEPEKTPPPNNSRSTNTNRNNSGNNRNSRQSPQR